MNKEILSVFGLAALLGGCEPKSNYTIDDANRPKDFCELRYAVGANKNKSIVAMDLDGDGTID